MINILAEEDITIIKAEEDFLTEGITIQTADEEMIFREMTLDKERPHSSIETEMMNGEDNTNHIKTRRKRTLHRNI